MVYYLIFLFQKITMIGGSLHTRPKKQLVKLQGNVQRRYLGIGKTCNNRGTNDPFLILHQRKLEEYVWYLLDRWNGNGVKSMELNNTIKWALILSLSGNLVGVGQGCAVGWLSPSLPILLSTDSPLTSGPITQTEASWIGSMIPFGGFFGTLFFGSLAYYIGSKHSLLYCTIPLIVSSSITIEYECGI